LTSCSRRDASGDLQAARTNDELFFPINRGHEDASWQRFFEEAADRFFSERCAGDYDVSLVAEFGKLLPDTPAWKKATK